MRFVLEIPSLKKVVLAGAVLCLFSSFQGMVWADPTSDRPADASDPPGKGDLTDASLESLGGMDVVVTSSSKKAEILRNATSAIFVITQDDIRRSGFQHVADLLFMVPGVVVSRQSANEWAISARGFNAQYNNKMLVLIDGRSIYDPVLGGVNWNEQDIPLMDIDRIEVIRGPGGTLWGSNAVNGIVNIITKDAKLTQGLYMTAAGGSNLYSQGVSGPYALNGLGVLRYGGKLSDDLYYRLYAQAANENPSANPKITPEESALGNLWNDDWYSFRAGFRADLHADQDQFMMEADTQRGYFNYARISTSIGAFFHPDTFISDNDLNTNIVQNAHILGRWTRDFNDDSQIQVLGYYDYRHLSTVLDSRTTNLGQADLEIQHHFHLDSWNEITWGGSYRNIADQFSGSINTYYSPEQQSLNIYSGFLQDRLTLADNKFYLTLGSKLENNPLTGNEWQPSGRLLFTPDEKNSIWASVSKAVRIPYQDADSAYIYLGGIPANSFGPGAPAVNTYGALIPNTDLASETLVAYELGYRTNPTKETSLDLSAFYNHYERLFSIQNVSGTFYSPAGGVIDSSVIAVQGQNTGTGDIYGLEASVKWDPLNSLKINLTYTFQDYDRALIDSSNVELGAVPPHNMFNMWIYFDPFQDWELSSNIYFTDTTFLYDPRDPVTNVPSFWVWNLGASWKPDPHCRLSFWGMDLEGAHSETLQSAFVSPAQVVPSLYGQLTLEY